MPVPTLPPELLDIVFDNLQPTDPSNAQYEDVGWPNAQEVREPLSACTLVSRSWYPLAREHLFRDVVYSFQRPPDDGPAAWAGFAIDSSHRWVAFPGSDSGVPIRWLPLKTLQMFLDFLRQCPVIRASVRKLTLSCYPSGTPNDMIHWPLSLRHPRGDGQTIDPTLLMSLVSSFPGLEHIRLYDVVITKPRAPESILPHVSVREARIVSRYFVLSAREVCNLATHFRDVGKFSLVSPSWEPLGYPPDNDDLPDDFPPIIALNTPFLALSYIYDSPPLLTMSQLLQKSPSARSLRRLCLTAVSLEATRGIDAVIKGCGPYLEYFKLVINFTGLTNGVNHILNLAPMFKLQELVVGFEMMVQQAGTYIPPWMEAFLEYYTTTNLSPKTNRSLRKMTLCLICEDRFIPPVDPKRAHEHCWGESALQSRISNFEAHFGNLVRTFGLEGMHVECNTLPSMWREAGSKERLRQALPLIFPILSQENLLIPDENPSHVV